MEDAVEQFTPIPAPNIGTEVVILRAADKLIFKAPIVSIIDMIALPDLVEGKTLWRVNLGNVGHVFKDGNWAPDCFQAIVSCSRTRQVELHRIG